MIVDGVKVQPIPGFPNYAISRDGKVWSNPRQRSSKQGIWIKSRQTKCGYLHCGLYHNGHISWVLIHRLVLETYVGQCPEGMQTRHLNGNKQDNKLENLCWGSKKENMKDIVNHGTRVRHFGEKNGQARLTEQDVRMIIYMYRTGLFLMQEIATGYKVGLATVSNIVNKKSWKHLWAKVA
jgi:hypothetical protein